MSSTFKRLAAVLAAGALVLGACSDGGGGGEEQAAENPEQAFSDALEALSEYEGITLVASIQADPAALEEDDTPPEVAEAIVNSSLTISAKGETAEDSQVQLVVNVDGEDSAELRFVDQSIYLRAAVADLVEQFGGDPSQVNAFAQQASAQGFDFAQALVDGEWVGVEGIDELAEQFGLPQPTTDPEQAAQIADQIGEILERNADVTSEGTDDVGAHLVVTVPLRETVQDLFEALQGLGGVPPGTLPAEDLGEIPDAEIPIDVWVSDGRLVQVELDVVEIATAAGDPPPEGVDEFAFRFTIDEFTDDVAAPDDFTPIDVEQLLQSFFGAALGGADSGGTPAVPGGNREVVVPELGLACSDLETLTGDQIEQFLSSSGVEGALETVRQECPELF